MSDEKRGGAVAPKLSLESVRSRMAALADSAMTLSGEVDLARKRSVTRAAMAARVPLLLAAISETMHHCHQLVSSVGVDWAELEGTWYSPAESLGPLYRCTYCSLQVQDDTSADAALPCTVNDGSHWWVRL